MGQKSTKMDFSVEVVRVFGEKQRITLCDTKKQFKSVTVEELKKKIIQSLSSRSRGRIYLVDPLGYIHQDKHIQ